MSAVEPTSTSDRDEAFCAACGHSFGIDQEFCPNDGAQLIKLQSGPDLLLGRVFDNRYEIRAALGSGGMGTVYRGWQRSVDREVAIKVIHPKLASDRVAAKRFLREARLSSRLNQANIVNVYDFGQSEDGILYIVMEMLRGHTLSQELENPLPLRRIATIARQICDALDAAHAHDIIHRDLKPGNIMLLDEPPGRDAIKVLDFGVAKSLVSESSQMTRTDLLVGTPLYMAPEQIRGKPTDGRSDLYSLGCILYQMACGQPPFLSENVNLTLAMHIRAPLPQLPPYVASALAALIERLLDKNPETRIATARAVHAAFDDIVDDNRAPSEPELARVRHKPPATTSSVDQVVIVPVESTGAPTNRRWWLASLAVGAVAVVAVVATIVLSRTNNVEGAKPSDAIEVVPAALDAGSRPEIASDASVAERRGVLDAAETARDASTRRAIGRAQLRTVDAGAAPAADGKRLRDAGAVVDRPDADIVMPNIDLLPTRRP